MSIHLISTETAPKRDATFSAPDSPGVIVFPPILFLGAVVLGVALQWVWPIHLWAALPARIAGGLLALMGGTMAISALRRLRCAGTHVHPGEPTTAIVSDGPYRLTRNPIYVGNTSAYLGLALLFNVFWPLPCLIPFLLLLHWGVVLREERYLEAKFDESYRMYKAHVRRWL